VRAQPGKKAVQRVLESKLSFIVDHVTIALDRLEKVISTLLCSPYLSSINSFSAFPLHVLLFLLSSSLDPRSAGQ
jgi:hypothetical protein